MRKEDFISDFNTASDSEGRFSKLNAIKYLKQTVGSDLGLRHCKNVVDEQCVEEIDRSHYAERVYTAMKKEVDDYPTTTISIETFDVIRCENCSSKLMTRTKGMECTVHPCCGRIVGEEIITTKRTTHE